MIYISLYIILTAISFVSVHCIGIKLPDILMMSLTAGYAILFFNIINYKTILSVYRMLFQNKMLFLLIQISVMVMWLGSFYVPIHYSPAILIFTFMGIVSCYGSIFEFIKNKDRVAFYKAISILAVLFTFYLIQLQYYSVMNYLIMFGLTFVTGSSCYLYIFCSNQLTKLNCSATEILAVRYWLFFFITLFFMIYRREYSAVNLHVLSTTLGLSFILLIIPIFFLQKSIAKLGGSLTAISMGLTPFATFILEKVVIKTTNNSVGYLTIALAFAIIGPSLIAQVKLRLTNREAKS